MTSLCPNPISAQQSFPVGFPFCRIVLGIGFFVAVNFVPRDRDDFVVFRPQPQNHWPLDVHKPTPLSFLRSFVIRSCYRCVLARTPENMDEENIQVRNPFVSELERTNSRSFLRQIVVHVSSMDVRESPTRGRKVLCPGHLYP